MDDHDDENFFSTSHMSGDRLREEQQSKFYAHSATSFNPSEGKHYEEDERREMRAEAEEERGRMPRPPTLTRAVNQTSENGTSISYVTFNDKKAAVNFKNYVNKKLGGNAVCVNGSLSKVKRIAKELSHQTPTDSFPDFDKWKLAKWSCEKPVRVDRSLEPKRRQICHMLNKFPSAQKIAHFPGMTELGIRERMVKNMGRMQRHFPVDYSFFPTSFVLPQEYFFFYQFTKFFKEATYICKPLKGSNGKGIFLSDNPKKVNSLHHHYMQCYIHNPLVIDGLRFDLRVFVLVTSIDPIWIYIFNEGLARFSSMKGDESSVEELVIEANKRRNSKRDFLNIWGKRKMTVVFERLEKEGYSYEVNSMKRKITGIVIKTLAAAHPVLKENYKKLIPKANRGSACFHLLAFDIIVDETFMPYLIEVDQAPAFHLDLPLEEEFTNLLEEDMLRMIYPEVNIPVRFQDLTHGAAVKQRKSLYDFVPSLKLKSRMLSSYEAQFTHELRHTRNFTLIYPIQGDRDEYAVFFDIRSGEKFEYPPTRAKSYRKDRQCPNSIYRGPLSQNRRFDQQPTNIYSFPLNPPERQFPQTFDNEKRDGSEDMSSKFPSEMFNLNTILDA